MSAKYVLALQLALYGLAWLGAARWLREARVPALHWAGYCGLQALMACATFDLPRALVGLVTLGSLALALRGMELFAVGRSRLDRLYLLLIAVDLAASGWIAMQPDAMPAEARRTAQVLSAYASMTVMALLPLPWLWRAMAPALGRRVSALALAPSALVGLWQGVVLGARLAWGPPGPAVREWLVPSAYAVSTVATVMFSLGALVLVLHRLVQRLQHTARHDHLTGVRNRLEADAVLARAHALQQRSGRGYAVAMLDLDRFKAINDARGHMAGDAALVCAARCFSHSARASDLVGRWGGEEFIVVMPETDAAHALEAAQRLLCALRQESRQALGYELTASIGVAQSQRDDASAEAVVARADAALYRAKAAGRDRVELATPAAGTVPGLPADNPLPRAA